MRWIDINLPAPETDQIFDTRLNEALDRIPSILALQETQGLDSPALPPRMAEVGRILFQALCHHDPEAFSPDSGARSVQTPEIGLAEHDSLVGYQIITTGPWASLPWHWLHNGIGFLLEKHPICTGDTSATFPGGAELRPWMERCLRARFLVDDAGDTDLYHTLDQLRPSDLDSPEVLFVAGHTDEAIRRLITREAEAIEGAMHSERLGARLADLTVPADSLTPSQLMAQGWNFQAIHFAGPTSQPVHETDTEGHQWMSDLIEEINAPTEEGMEGAVGLEGELVGVDPITALLDSVGEKYEREGLEEGRAFGSSLRGKARAENGNVPWLLDDGPVGPEAMSFAGGLPPLVFSNSYRSLPELGERFTTAGASTFIGPVVPLFSRPARLFTGYFYRNLADGWSCGAALWRACGQLRAELGPEHPAWLSYGVRGYGSLALQYL